MRIKNRKCSLYRSIALNAGDTFDIYVDINNITFQPDEVIIRNVFMNADRDNNCYLLYSTLVQNSSTRDGSLCLIQDLAGDSLQSYNIRYPIHTPIQGEYRFWVRDLQGDIFTTATNDSFLFLHLEFVEYHKD